MLFEQNKRDHKKIFFDECKPFQQWLYDFWDPSFYTEDNRGTLAQLSEKVQTLTDAPE